MDKEYAIGHIYGVSPVQESWCLHQMENLLPSAVGNVVIQGSDFLFLLLLSHDFTDMGNYATNFIGYLNFMNSR